MVFLLTWEQQRLLKPITEMVSIFDFGISQEDARIEHLALNIKDGDRLLCVSSAGEVPLNILALNDIRIKAVDVSVNQNHLTKLKLYSILSLEPLEAAKFLGFTKSTREQRERLYSKVSESMHEKEKLFWNQNFAIIKTGPIHAARFEKYISKFNGIALRIIGKKNMIQLFESSSIENQKELFDRKINSSLLKKIFQVTFHPRLYKNRGIAPEGLIYRSNQKISEFFFNKFRDFCCSTLARKNYYLQLTFFSQVLFPEAFPEYLMEEGVARIRKNYKNIEISTMPYLEALKQSKKEEFNRFHLSNIGDWMNKNEFADLLRLINTKSSASGRINSRYIYYRHPIPDDLKECFVTEDQFGEKLTKQDRYPFYGLTPIKIHRNQT